MSYHDYSESVFCSLRMNGGDIKVSKGSLNISGSLMGNIRNFEITNQGSIFTGRYDATRSGNFITPQDGRLYTTAETKNSLDDIIKSITKEREILDKFKTCKIGEDQAYKRYKLIKEGKEEQLYTKQILERLKKEYGALWIEIAAMDLYGLKGGGTVGLAVTGMVTGFVADKVFNHGGHHRANFAPTIGVSSSGHVAGGFNRQSVQYQLQNQARAQRERESNIQASIDSTIPTPRQKNTEYWKELEKIPNRLRLAKEISSHFRDVSQYIPKGHWNRPNPLTQIHNAYSIKVDCTEYINNRNYFSTLYKSMKTAGIPHQDIVSVLGNPYIGMVTNWNNGRVKGDSEIYGLAFDINEQRHDFANVLSRTTPEVSRFVNDFAIPVSTIHYSRIFIDNKNKSQLIQAAGKVVSFLSEIADGFNRAMIPGYSAYADGGSVEEIVTSVGSDLILTYCGGKAIKVGYRGLKAVGAQMLSKATAIARPTWQQTEQYVGKLLGKKARPQVSYLYGKEVARGTLGSVRPDFINGRTAVEAKNYDIAKNSSGLITKVVEQVNKRAIHLPKGMKQEIQIDIRGQRVTEATFRQIQKKIAEKCNGALREKDIKWIGKFVEQIW